MMEPYCPVCHHKLPVAKGTFVDHEMKVLFLDGGSVKAPFRVLQVLEELITCSPRVVSRGRLMDHIYGLECEVDEPNQKIIDVYIVRARQAVQDSNYEIVTEWGRGWIFRQKVLHDGRENNEEAVLQN